MFGVAALLDDQTDQLVKDVWAELREKVGIRTIADFLPIPHISLHLAEDYHRDRIRALLDELSTEIAPFTIRITGLGIFTHPQQVLYLPVTRSEGLRNIHKTLWKENENIATNPSPYYGDTHWMPHITLAQHDIDTHTLSQIMPILGERDLNCEVTINSLALLAGSTQDQSGIIYEVRLSGPAE